LDLIGRQFPGGHRKVLGEMLSFRSPQDVADADNKSRGVRNTMDLGQDVSLHAPQAFLLWVGGTQQSSVRMVSLLIGKFHIGNRIIHGQPMSDNRLECSLSPLKLFAWRQRQIHFPVWRDMQ